MELVQTLTSSVVRFVVAKPNDVFVPDVIRYIEKRYKFWSVPRSLEEYAKPDGAAFTTGVFNGVAIESLTVYNNGFMVVGKADTDQLDEIADDIVRWSKAEFGLEYESLQPLTHSYSSTVEVRTDVSVARYVDSLTGVSSRLSALVSACGFQLDAPYEFTTLTAIADPELARPLKPGRFVFDRRANVPFSSNRFWSEAPVATKDHMELLNLLEQAFMDASV